MAGGMSRLWPKRWYSSHGDPLVKRVCGLLGSKRGPGVTRAPTRTQRAAAPHSLEDVPTAMPSHAQVFYHLGELDDALNYALGAGSLFDVEEQSEYVTTLVGE